MCNENPSRFLFALFTVEVSPLMQVQSRSFVQESVMVYLRGLLSMKDKYQTIFQYQSVMAWVRSLLNDGIITQSEYNKIDTNIAKRYGIVMIWLLCRLDLGEARREVWLEYRNLCENEEIFELSRDELTLHMLDILDKHELPHPIRREKNLNFLMNDPF